jgi:hypothetical protein
MKRSGALFLIIGVFCFAFPAFAQESKIIIVGTTSKELKRTAHRLHISVEQLKNARNALQEATDLARKIKPLPISQLYSLRDSWRQLNRSKAKEFSESFIQDLRSEASNAADFNSYQQATSTAMPLIQSNDDFDYEKAQELIRSWPKPPDSAPGELADKFLSNLEANVRQNAISTLANRDPEKARALLEQSGNSEGHNYFLNGQIAQGFMNAGKKDEAFAIIDQTINDFRLHPSDPQALQTYQNFAQLTARIAGPARAGAIITPLITQLMNQKPSENCASGIMKAGDVSVDLTCAEMGVLNMVRNFQSMPALANTTLSSFPSLKSKLDQVGGIDSIYGNSGMSISTRFPTGSGSYQIYDGSVSNSANNVSGLIRELKGKAESNPSYVRGKLKDFAKGPQGIDMLINLISSSSYEDPELGSLALEVAKSLVSQVEPLQKRSSTLQNLIRASRQVDGEVDSEIIRDGFILADRLREDNEKTSEAVEISSVRTNAMGMTSGGQSWIAQEADRLEAYLVSELSKDDFEKAIRYVHSIKSDALKLTCLIQITQALRQQYY